jgi:hypothetical protein
MSRYSPRTLTAQASISNWGKAGGPPAGKVPTSITYSVTAGNGGGGGNQNAYPFNGGSGCGGANSSGTYTTLGARDYFVTVGAGGNAGVSTNTGACASGGGAGGSSTFGIFTASGGGGGAGACGDHAGNCGGGSSPANPGNPGSVVITYTQTDTTQLATIPAGLTYTLSTNAVAGSYRYTFTAGSGLVQF